MANITIYTDGSANNADHNKGGYGIVMINGSIRQFIGGSYINTTSARMEIMGVIKAMKKCVPGDVVTIYCDNQYVVHTLEKQWIFRWKQQNFAGKKNKDLWQKFLIEYERLEHRVELKWIKGHANNEMNELADVLADLGANRKQIIKDHKQ
jgi:ribonuclease HI